MEIPILEVEVLAAKGDMSGAEKLLLDQRAARPKEPEFWVALAMLADRKRQAQPSLRPTPVSEAGRCSQLWPIRNGPMRAHSILDEAKGKLGDKVELRVARLHITQYESKEQAVAVLNGLAAGTENFALDDRVRLLRRWPRRTGSSTTPRTPPDFGAGRGAAPDRVACPIAPVRRGTQTQR